MQLIQKFRSELVAAADVQPAVGGPAQQNADEELLGLVRVLQAAAQPQPDTLPPDGEPESKRCAIEPAELRKLSKFERGRC